MIIIYICFRIRYLKLIRILNYLKCINYMNWYRIIYLKILKLQNLQIIMIHKKINLYLMIKKQKPKIIMEYFIMIMLKFNVVNINFKYILMILKLSNIQ